MFALVFDRVQVVNEAANNKYIYIAYDNKSGIRSSQKQIPTKYNILQIIYYCAVQFSVPHVGNVGQQIDVRRHKLIEMMATNQRIQLIHFSFVLLFLLDVVCFFFLFSRAPLCALTLAPTMYYLYYLWCAVSDIHIVPFFVGK